MTTQGVEERTKGTIPEAEGKKSPEAKGKTPEDASKVSPEKETPIYMQAQAEALVHAAKSDAGRLVKDAETATNTLKSQLLSKDNEIEDVRADLETLQTQIKDLSSDDPKKFDLVTRERTLKQAERKLSAERLTLDTDKQSHAETIKLAGDTLREVNIWNVASEYKDSDPARLKDLCDTFEVKTEEQIRKVAEALWAKKEAGEPEKKTLKPYSGDTSGGGDNLGSLSPKDRLKEVTRRLTQ